MAEIKIADILASVDREAEMRDTMRQHKEEMAEFQRLREEFQATHEEELERIAGEEAEAIRRGEEIVRLAKERRAATAAMSASEGSTLLELRKMEKDEEAAGRERVMAWKDMKGKAWGKRKDCGRHVQSHQQRKRRQKQK